jgi:glycine cleavage system H protein
MKFTETHEWVELEGNIGTIGVTKHAQEELGEIVYVELPEMGVQVNAGEEAVVLESTKAAADVYSPVSGKVCEVNSKLSDQSNLINESAEAEGWLYKIELDDLTQLDSLMDREDYEKMHAS